MNAHDNDPFDVLFDDSLVENQNELIAETITPYMRFTSRTDPEIMFTDEGDELTVREKLLVFFLAWKVLSIKGIVSSEDATPKQIEQTTGIPGGSIRPTLKKLLDDKLIRSQGDGYIVPNSRIKRINDMLVQKG